VVILSSDPGGAIVLGAGPPGLDMPPGSLRDLHLVVADAVPSRHARRPGGRCRGDGRHPQGIKFVGFSDPDGNTWVFQKIPWRSAEFTAG
jgi:hypothetical protein